MISKGIIKIIKCYQRMPLSTHNQCKFIPSCSNYAIEALEIHGFFKGMYLAIRRILRCNPWNKGGIDNVPRK